ncbi:MAG: 4Fe-4S binding protein [Bacteroidales bacterium]|jgi:MinD superfamily P-loop ATPase|nr:4Fe-4S binding protein [Bacteroidales bacterium]
MKQLLILSGKGGTGKTTVSSAFIELSKCRAFADCDVDAPNLHFVVTQMPKAEETDYYGFQKAVIDEAKCIKCGLCEKTCRFDAIKNNVVGLYECEGCSVCAQICPVGAITMTDHASGSMMLYKDKDRVFSTARLNMGSGAPGKLVAEVKKRLTDMSIANLAIIDGSPGIGCPVIASISGADMVLIVAEPTISGIHDMKRIIDTAKHFGVSCAVCINKFDVNADNTKEIERYCNDLKIPVTGKIPFDKTVIEAVNKCRSIAYYPDSPAGSAIAKIWEDLYFNYLEGGGG